jgi:ribosomal protein L7/L12
LKANDEDYPEDSMSQGLCPSCGAAVNLTAGQTETKCQYCENVVTFQQAEERFTEVKNSKVGGKLVLAEISLKSGDYEKALGFYDKVIEQDEKAVEAWLGRGICLVHNLFELSDGDGFYHDTKGAISSLEAAIQFATNAEAMDRRAARVIAEYVSECKKYRADHRSPFIIKDAAHENGLLAWVIEKDPRSEYLLKTGVGFYAWAIKELRSECPFVMEAPPLKPIDNAYLSLSAETIQKLQEFERNLHASLVQSSEKYRTAWQQISPDAAASMSPVLTPLVDYGLPTNVVELILKGNDHKIAAIKELRSIRAGLGLAEAKKIVEEAGVKLGTMSVTKGGCFVATACYGNYWHSSARPTRATKHNFF